MSVYFIQSVDEHGPVKIGKANKVERRLDAIRTCHPFPLHLVYAIDVGDQSYELEHALHVFLADLRIERTEWFRANADIGDLIRYLREIEDARQRQVDVVIDVNRRSGHRLVLHHRKWPYPIEIQVSTPSKDNR